MINKKKIKNILWLYDILILNIIFCVLHYLKFSFIIPSGVYLALYFTFILFWSLFSFYYDKYNSTIDNSILLTIRLIIWSSLISLLFIVISISFSDMWSISRAFILTLTLMVVLFEIISLLVFKIFLKTLNKTLIQNQKESKKSIERKFFLKWLIPGAISLILIYTIIVIIRTGFFKYTIFHEHNFLLLLSAWGISTLLTNRYKSPNTINHFYEIAPYLKASILTFLLLNFFYFTLRINESSINLILQVGLIHSLIETLAFFLYFFGQSKINNDTLQNLSSIEHLNSDQEKLDNKEKRKTKQIVYKKDDLKQSLKYIENENNNKIIDFIWNSIKSEITKKSKFIILNTKSAINIRFLSENSKEIIINIHKLNDIRRLNAYFLDVYSKLENDGLLIGNFIPLEGMDSHLRSQMPHFLYFILSPFYFIFFRVFPKLTITKQIYFIVTQGKNRVFSKSEVLGRLSFCGYELINEKMIDETFYFIAKKKKTISQEEFPSYGPIVKLKRIGYHGKRIYIYKIRTMYPYSEFIQGDIYEKYHLDKSGKLKSDFRITSWGKIFRSYFIDEIPQLYNWLIGDIKIIGVRALSEHYFSLYPKDIQELRIKSKPGLVPPYYADMPESFQEIVESEKIYLLKKQINPILTDAKYFIKAIYNIVFYGARSK